MPIPSTQTLLSQAIIKYAVTDYFIESAPIALVSAPIVVVVSVIGGATIVFESTVVVIESVVVVLSLLLLQAVNAPATAKMANNFFMRF